MGQMWKFINGNLIDPNHIIGIMPELGTDPQGHESYQLMVLIDTGHTVVGGQIIFDDEVVSDPIEAEESEMARKAVLYAHIAQLADILGFGVDHMTAESMMWSSDCFEQVDPEDLRDPDE